MSAAPGPVFERMLRELRQRGEPVAVADLARRLFASPAPLAGSLARRLVAHTLDWPSDELPEDLSPDALRRPEDRRVAELTLEAASFAVVDLETTGLSAGECEILEVGAVRIEGLRMTDRFDSLVRPSAPIPPRISSLTGIEDADVAEAPGLDEVMLDFRSWLDRTPRACFVAHNAGFDARFVTYALAACALPPLGVPVLCTRRLARRLAPEIGRYNLDSVSAHFGVSNRARHRALGDALAAAEVLVALLHRARESEIAQMGALLDLQERPPRPRKRPRRPAATRRRRTKPPKSDAS